MDEPLAWTPVHDSASRETLECLPSKYWAMLNNWLIWLIWIEMHAWEYQWKDLLVDSRRWKSLSSPSPLSDREDEVIIWLEIDRVGTRMNGWLSDFFFRVESRVIVLPTRRKVHEFTWSQTGERIMTLGLWSLSCWSIQLVSLAISFA